MQSCRADRVVFTKNEKYISRLEMVPKGKGNFFRALDGCKTLEDTHGFDSSPRANPRFQKRHHSSSYDDGILQVHPDGFVASPPV